MAGMIRQFIDDAMEYFVRLDGSKPKRLPGFHASRSGMCKRMVLLETLKPSLKRPVDKTGMKIFAHGTLLHDFMDEAMRTFAGTSDEFLWLSPPKTRMFKKSMTEAFEKISDKGSDIAEVIGHGDFFLIHVPTKTILFADFKSANERAFAAKKKKGMSVQNAMQLATYMCDEGGIISLLGDVFEIETPEVVYINKKDLETEHFDVDLDIWVDLARRFWIEIAEAAATCIRSGGETIPPPVPQEKWMCDYCSMFKNNAECRAVNSINELIQVRDVKNANTFRR